MKFLRHSLLCSFFILLGVASLTYAASTTAVTVTVSNSSGKVVFTGKTDAGGNFTTGKLPSGNYIVQFTGTLKEGSYALLVSAGKEKTNADSLPAKKFTKGGVAMRIAVAEPVSLNGQVAPAGTIKTGSAQSASTGKSKGLKTKMINGHEYVWVPPEQGDWNGGKWVDANSIEARNAEADHHSTKSMHGGTQSGDR
jgi:hypothetical protein